jgi:hypothetical protein
LFPAFVILLGILASHSYTFCSLFNSGLTNSKSQILKSFHADLKVSAIRNFLNPTHQMFLRNKNKSSISPFTIHHSPFTFHHSTSNFSPKNFRSSTTECHNGIPRCSLSVSISRSGSPGIKTCSSPSTVFALRNLFIQ